MIRLVVLDFDGTLTDADASAAPFLDAFPSLLGEAPGRPLGDAWTRALDDASRGAPEDAWVVDGHAVAPGDADPYVRATRAARALLPGEDARVEACFRAAYARVSAVMRPSAARVLGELRARGLATCVVTNAHGDAVERHLAPLSVEGVRVFGDARKYAVRAASAPHAAFDALPHRLHVEGLRRPVLLRRGAYLDALRAAWTWSGASPAETLCCGDVHELDLALPAALGCAVHLVERPTTHAYERRAVQATGARGAVTSDVTGVLARL